MLRIYFLYFLIITSFSLHAEEKIQFCWRDSYFRAVGTIPSGCPDDRQKIGLLCYSKCPQNYKRFGFDCHQSCTNGFEDQGLFCRKAQYSRGLGYPWNFGDSLNQQGMRERCQKQNGKGNCQKNGLIYYPKCKSGFESFGCCICRPAVPDCKALGYNGGIDLSCSKKIILGDPVLGICDKDQQRNAGLCYPKCKKGFEGIGPVCWEEAPQKWVTCGMGAAINSQKCASQIFDQVTSAGSLALSIASLGSSSVANVALNGLKKVITAKQTLEGLRQKFKKLKQLIQGNSIQKLKQLAKQKVDGSKLLDGLQNIIKIDPLSASEDDIISIAAQIAALADPTGVITAYKFKICSAAKK